MKRPFKQHALRLLVGLNAVLLCVLIALWFAPDGSLRSVAWMPPEPRLTNFASQLPVLPRPAPADISAFVALLEKPLFSPSRRPPVIEAPKEVVVVPVDNFSSAKLTGIFNSAGASGLIMTMAGKDMRVQLRQSVDGWVLESLTDHQATFANSGQTRVLQLKRADVSQAAAGTPNARSGGAAPASLPFVPAPVASPVATDPAGAADSAAKAVDPSGSAAGPTPNKSRAVFGGTRR